MNLDIPFLQSLLSFAASITALCLAALMIFRDRRSFVNRIFALAMILLALQEVFRGMGFQAPPQSFLFWQKARISVTALLPGMWLMFSLSFGRSDWRRQLKSWQWAVAAVFVIPFLTIWWEWDSFFLIISGLIPEVTRTLPLGSSGKVYHFWLLLSAILILYNLERTLRASSGHIRWQIKFLILGVGAIAGAWIYSCSQTLLYNAVDPDLGVIHPVTLLIANVLFLWGIYRSQYLHVEVYFSRTSIQYSITILLTGAYLILVGLLAQFLHELGPEWSLPWNALLVLLALIGLAFLMMSDRLQERLRRLIIRHLKRPKYDYRKIWMDLTERTSSLNELGALCTETAQSLGRTMDFLSVSIWLLGDPEQRLTLAGSSAFSSSQAGDLTRSGEIVGELIGAIEGGTERIDLETRSYRWSDEIMAARPEFFKPYPMRYILPIKTGGKLAGIITLNNDRVGFAPLSIEDQDLLHAYSAHLAANVLQLRLAEHQRRAKEMEALQNVSSFFIHDLKNLVSRLALTVQNMAVHFENPDFRSDAQRTLERSVHQINDMCRNLSLLRQPIELKKTEADLNALIAQTLVDMEKGMKVTVQKDWGEIPPCRLDVAQIRKVVTNLILNAEEAVDAKGIVFVSTGQTGRYVYFSVTDNGHGMSEEFIAKTLFKPFQSTKKRGMGIGLFHSKMLVEAHQGWIEVKSQPGEGTTFRVHLPC